jgi:hypothetical protein
MTFPLLIYGATNVPGGGSVTLNPLPSANGLQGEIKALPYKVPATMTLQLQQWGLSAPDVGGTSSMFPIIGGATTDTRKRLPAATALGGVGVVQGIFTIPPNTVLTVGLVNTQNATSLISWYVLGNLY